MSDVKFRSSNRTSDYYTLGGEKGMVTVTHTAFDTLVCLSCLVIECRHTKAVAEFIKAGGGPEKNAVERAAAR